MDAVADLVLEQATNVYIAGIEKEYYMRELEKKLKQHIQKAYSLKITLNNGSIITIEKFAVFEPNTLSIVVCDGFEYMHPRKRAAWVNAARYVKVLCLTTRYEYYVFENVIALASVMDTSLLRRVREFLVPLPYEIPDGARWF